MQHETAELENYIMLRLSVQRTHLELRLTELSLQGCRRGSTPGQSTPARGREDPLHLKGELWSI